MPCAVFGVFFASSWMTKLRPPSRLTRILGPVMAWAAEEDEGGEGREHLL